MDAHLMKIFLSFYRLRLPLAHLSRRIGGTIQNRGCGKLLRRASPGKSPGNDSAIKSILTNPNQDPA